MIAPPHCTELREAVATDPYAHLLADLWTRAWADGYQAANEHVVGNEASHVELRRLAYEALFTQQSEVEARLLLALAAVGGVVPPVKL